MPSDAVKIRKKQKIVGEKNHEKSDVIKGAYSLHYPSLYRDIRQD